MTGTGGGEGSSGGACLAPAKDLEALGTDVLAGFVLARAAAGDGDLPEVRPTARNYTARRLMAEVRLCVNETCKLDLASLR
ncbi:hypothetical protein GCM10012278_21250 [Nonomuraea glycinis]|uniref:Uncharacterized protein n=1 Tax=Nonomuraea glycinis TaxID=2047744 RepID=A0A918A3G8_9ACTN|nr:hypothetical protein GCM10012278_21250 [Nonomuraea glycinis]